MANNNIHNKNIRQIKGGRNVNSSFVVFMSVVMVIIFLFIISIFLGINLFFEKKLNSMSYSEKGDLEYSVCLNSNDFFEDECLDMDREYIASLINKIVIDFNYSFSASKSFDYKYSYYIQTEVIATEKTDSKVIYDKKEILIPKKEVSSSNSNNYVITKSVNIDYGKYNAIMQEFKKQYAILFDSKLIVSLVVETKGNSSYVNQDINSKQVMKMEIPLSEQTIDVTFNQKEINNNKTLYEQIDENSRKLMGYIFIAICIINVFLIVGCILYVRKRIDKRNKFEIELSKIMKENDRFITVVKNAPSFENKDVLGVTSFQESLDTREFLNKPILYFEMRKREKGCFLIISDDIIYIYVIGK